MSGTRTARVERLVETAERVRAAGGGTAVLDWWRALAELTLMLALRTRGWQVTVDGHWLAVVPPESPCLRLSHAHSLATGAFRHESLTDEMRAQLSSFWETNTGGDVVLEVARVLAVAVIDSAYLQSAPASDTTRLLLGGVQAIATEFETNGLRSDEMPTPLEGQPDVTMPAFILLAGMSPRAGKEVDAALDQCEHLAHHLLGQPTTDGRPPRPDPYIESRRSPNTRTVALPQPAQETARWYTRKDPTASPKGPFDADDILEAFSSGNLGPRTLVCREGDEAWHSLREHAEALRATRAPRS